MTTMEKTVSQLRAEMQGVHCARPDADVGESEAQSEMSLGRYQVQSRLGRGHTAPFARRWTQGRDRNWPVATKRMT